MELDILRAIQSIGNPFLDVLFQLITILGEQTIIVVIMVSIYWSYDKVLGEYIVYSSLTGVLVNNSIKDIFKMQRPIGEDGIRSLRVETATGYSFPSGHTQQATTFYGSLFMYTKKKWLYILSIIVITLVGFSRMYLGVHYPKDVLFGVIFGVLTIIITNYLFKRINNKLLLYTITFIVFLPALTFARSSDFIKGLGTFLGFIIGVFIERRYVNFSVEGTRFNKIVRVLLGILILMILITILKIVFPKILFFDFIRYMIISIYGIGLYPALFKRLKL